MAVLDGMLYAVGGLDAGHNHPCLSSVERYDPATNAWEEMAPMAVRRRSLAVAVLDGKLYAVGGMDDNFDALSSVERYDAATNAWEAVAPMAQARHSHVVAVLDGKLYAVGGWAANNWRPGSLSSVERYDAAENVWVAVAPMATARDQTFAVFV